MDIEIPDYVVYKVLAQADNGTTTVSNAICFKCALTNAMLGHHIVTEAVAKGDYSPIYCEACDKRLFAY